ncbi:hypothetical protein KSD_06770 [Ktedonobacter sp. SOSP1-85]|uniref:DUF2298 domain-containing protein n=1 Tax=Ktedonobacter sp. SOSP1-85 TaxID=2778367 RepID=UPI001915FC33|nr:DUF2298 domain-containing protein [Ktedonobacter sp. SOSP1-85]GHO72906.1 hypothetical protein KSD_06770 [Ktedonobacter sp. SOSP1-85]
MIDLLAMIVLAEVLGLFCLPLTFSVFRHLPDRGWAFSKGLAIALLTFCAWFPLMVVRALPYTQMFLIVEVLVLTICSIPGLLKMRGEIGRFVKTQWPYVVASEVVFIGMVLGLGWIRGYGPDIRSYEMFMDGGFLASIMRSEHLPPSDMWYSGSSINYYYYGHFIVATLAKLLGQVPAVAFNTGFCLLFGVCAANLFGVASNIVAWSKGLRARRDAALVADGGEQSEQVYPLSQAILYGGASVASGLVLGNLAAFVQWWFDSHAGRVYDWFSPSRVIGKTINEFPAFSYLLDDFHAHVLTYSFTFMAIGLAFSLLLAPAGKGLDLFGQGIARIATIGVTALVVGSLFVMNGWDYPTYMGLVIICIAWQQWRVYEHRWRWLLLLDIFAAAGTLVALSFLLFLPFYMGFISPSQGIGIVSPGQRSPLWDEVLIFGLQAFIFLSLLICGYYRLIGARLRSAREARAEGVVAADWNPAWIVLGAVVVLGIIAAIITPEWRTFLISLALTALAIYLAFKVSDDLGHMFALWLGALALLLIAGCEVVFLRDVFADSYPRMNSVFKFYFQSWGLLALASGTGLFYIRETLAYWSKHVRQPAWLKSSAQGVWYLGLVVLVVMAMAYPLVAPYARYVQSKPLTGALYLQHTLNLDGMEYLKTSSPGDKGDYEAIHWLNAHVSGTPVIVEALGDDYSKFARVSALTGLPTLMGWVGHEYQWRVNWLRNPVNAEDFQQRQTDIKTIYTSSDNAQVQSLLKHYQVTYLYVGEMEREAYAPSDLQRFSSFMDIAYQADGVTIYKVR